MNGYWKMPERSFVTEDGLKWYRTGDLVEQDEKGQLIYKGRNDRMIKRHGFRVEPAEIELKLLSHPSITECAVISSVQEEQVKITAFVCFSKPEEFSFTGLKEFSVKHLPSYMIPDNFILLETLPQTSSNKTDLQSLKKIL
jgi:acyl-coenzyme A synthetase/AMP-(fatty) acid ligase